MLAIRAATAICPPKPTNHDQAQLLSSGLSTSRVLQIIAIVSTVVTALLTCGLIVMHLLRFRIPSQQRQIIRLVALPFIYAVFSLLEISFYDASDYLRPLADLYEAFALACLLMLFVQFVESKPTIPGQNMKRPIPGHSEKLLRHVWVLVFQYPAVRTITTIATEGSLATGRYCTRSNNVQFANLWITIIQSLSVALAVGSVVRFFMVVKSKMATHRPGLKLLSFKLIVFLSFLQSLIFNILNAKGALKGSTYVSYDDISLGIPAVLISLECVLFATLNFFAFRSSEYSAASLIGTDDLSIGMKDNSNVRQGSVQANDSAGLPLKLPLDQAVFSVLNPWDLLEGFGEAFRIVTGSKSSSGIKSTGNYH